MKIALISTPFFGVYPPTYGGLEVVVGNLARALVDRGHRVVLIAPDESQNFKGGYVYRTGPASSTVNTNWLELEKTTWNKYDKILDDFDIVHGHTWFGMYYRSKLRNPNIKVCHTHHGHVDPKYWLASPPPFKLNFIGISKFMRDMYESGYNGQMGRIPSRYAYNGIDMQMYPFQRDKSNRLMYLGRIDPIKAPHVAIQVAESCKTKIDIVGGTSFIANRQYVDDIRKQCLQSDYANFVGEVDHQTKLRYLQNAKALLIPSQFGEPFGLIACESMACGTVPIALRDGALSEIIEHNKSGFICNNVNELVQSVSRIDTIDSPECRRRAEVFSKENMAKSYETHYNSILSGDEW